MRSRAAYPPPRLLLTFYVVMLEIWPKIVKNSTQHRPKSIKNQSKIIKNRSWAFWEVPERSWRRLESVLGAVLGGPWAVLGASWAILGDLGRFLGRLGGQVGSKLEPENLKKSIPKSIKIVMRFGIDFWTDFGGFWCKNGTGLAPKLNQKSMLISKGGFSKKPLKTYEKTGFLRFRVVEIWRKNQPKIDQK